MLQPEYCQVTIMSRELNVTLRIQHQIYDQLKCLIAARVLASSRLITPLYSHRAPGKLPIW